LHLSQIALEQQLSFVFDFTLMTDVTLSEMLIDIRANRLSPISLTAGGAMFGAFVIILDRIFLELAWSFIFGIFVSALLSLLVIPVIYFFG